jgi:hypothetical protein
MFTIDPGRMAAARMLLGEQPDAEPWNADSELGNVARYVPRGKAAHYDHPQRLSSSGRLHRG